MNYKNSRILDETHYLVDQISKLFLLLQEFRDNNLAME